MSMLPYSNRGAPLTLNSGGYFSNDGHSQYAWYAGTQYNSLYDAVSNKTFVAYYTVLMDAFRLVRVRAYDHTAKTWGRSHNVGLRSYEISDDHGVPGMALNADGRLVVSYGNHNGNFRLSVSTNPRDETSWSQAADLVGAYTYPHLVLLADSSMVCLFRKNYMTGEGGYTSDWNSTLVYRILTFAGTAVTAGAEVEVGGMNTELGSRWYQSAAILGGDGLIHQTASRANHSDTMRLNVYYYKIDIANQQLVSFDGLTSVPFPVTNTDMTDTFKIYTTAEGNTSNTPAFGFDAAGRSHVVTHEGYSDPGGNPYYPQDIKHMVGSAGVFSAAVTIGQSDCRYNSEAVVPIADGGICVMWMKNTIGVDQRGGDLVGKNLAAGGASTEFGPEITFMKQDVDRYALDSCAAVKDGHANLRVIFMEMTQERVTALASDQRCYAWGDRGMVPGRVRPFVKPKALTGDGFWLDLSDTTAVFSDAGVTNAALDDNVNQINDKFGTGNTLYNVSDTSSPVLARVGNQYCLQFSAGGNGSRYLTGQSKAWAAGGYMVTAVLRPFRDGTAIGSVLSLDQGSGNPRVAIPIDLNTENVRATTFSLSGPTILTITDGANVVKHGQDHIIQSYTIGAMMYVFVNGVLVASGTNSGGVVNTAAVLMRIGATAAATPAFFYMGLMTGLIHRVGEQTPEMRDADYAWALAQLPS
ncbi:BNR-4 repeat-containing protein [Mesorhizobium ventifaucium]|uniref:LamG domain-containing protein n=1 Tax=Mesorhizobium ventifaucium TaxID=666020 RepID=A0ABM9EFE1_9HYPH|nr:BNR-4 repeat-containing protein [Mesorhizobium ventifaucium]CAH2408028.1 hypothetical protein MES4922_90023 [Mesorhizobium ventifaucium]